MLKARSSSRFSLCSSLISGSEIVLGSGPCGQKFRRAPDFIVLSPRLAIRAHYGSLAGDVVDDAFGFVVPQRSRTGGPANSGPGAELVLLQPLAGLKATADVCGSQIACHLVPERCSRDRHALDFGALYPVRLVDAENSIARIRWLSD